MTTEFRRADPAQELRSLMRFDRDVFSAADRFPADYWLELECYWLFVGRTKVGCCAFERGRRDREWFIATTGIHPKFQGQGWGKVMKAWQVAIAKHRGFRKLVTTCRSRNAAMISLNRSAGF